jgi:hypothetical protein
MIDWISKLLGGPAEKTTPPGNRSVDPELILLFREQIQECEALYRAAGHLCRRACPDLIDGDVDKFPNLMIDLHRGLLLKVFFEIAKCDRRWEAQERQLALMLLRHAWGTNVGRDRLPQVLRNCADYAETLKWESLVGPFLRMPPLADQIADVQT